MRWLSLLHPRTSAPATMGPGGLGLLCLFRGPDEYVDGEAIDKLVPIGDENDADTLTIEGELNKLAANISIGRNMAGVHYYTDYYDSLRIGERIAVGVLQEQMSTYPEEVSMRLTSFDNDRLIIYGDGKATGKVEMVISRNRNSSMRRRLQGIVRTPNQLEDGGRRAIQAPQKDAIMRYALSGGRNHHKRTVEFP